VNDREVTAALKEIQRLATEIAAEGGDYLALQNRAIEIAAMADVMIGAVSPDEISWLDDLYAVTKREDQ
jgi:hypothetical protein